MSLDEICAFPVADLAADDCVLWLWTTNAHMRDSFRVLDAWGFEPKTILTWAKPRYGVGNWLWGQTEHCHLAVRGKPHVRLIAHSTLLTAPRGSGVHSAKPDAFYELVEQLCPGSKVELFARRARPGFVTHGATLPRLTSPRIEVTAQPKCPDFIEENDRSAGYNRDAATVLPTPSRTPKPSAGTSCRTVCLA
jgi:N6-adenosine-specific RNA methylase IME4